MQLMSIEKKDSGPCDKSSCPRETRFWTFRMQLMSVDHGLYYQSTVKF